MLLALLTRASDAPRTPKARPRVWYQLLFKVYEPRSGKLTPEEALGVIARNWGRSYQDIKRDGAE